MKSRRKNTFALLLGVMTLLILGSAEPAAAQVNPAEIANPRLKAAQTAYFPQIKALYKQINESRFPFPFALGRYVGLDPSQQPESDARGIEFVFFHDRLILKISGSYNAAFNADRLSQNERAGHTFSEVIGPVLSLTTRNIPGDVDCDGIGFEVSFHVRTRTNNYDYEGKEILVVVLDRADAYALASASNEEERQEILNRSEVFLNGKEFGLALQGKEPLSVESLGRSTPPKGGTARGPSTPITPPRSGSNLVDPALLPPELRSQRQSDVAALRSATSSAPQPVTGGGSAPEPNISGGSGPTVTTADADRLQAQYQIQLDALTKLGMEKFHFVSYAPPSFVIYRNQVMLQLTMRNTIHFSQDSTSLYKRAAQSFDLFLAGQLKDILDKIPGEASFAGFDITIVNQFGTDAHSSSEAIEFICPRNLLRRFVDADITNQQLIDQSVVLVNGVRIALNLQMVE